MSSIAFHDPVYGGVCFTEPLLVDLYNSRAVQRLADIHQGGITAFIKPERSTTRLHHSRGVAALLQRLGAGVVEQAAGLVHDVAHTAFSHVVDFVYPNRDHDYHEVHRDEVILSSDLPDILANHGLDWRKVTEAGNYPLLEQPLPQLCADRLDYFLRDGIMDVGTFSQRDGAALLEHLVVHQGQIAVDSLDAAQWLGEHFIQLDDACWCSVQEVGWYAVMAKALRVALAREIITETDFGGTDRAVMDTLGRAHDAEIDHWLQWLRRDVDFARVEGESAGAYDLVALPKVRAIDPPVLLNGSTTPLSELDPPFAARRHRYITGKEGSWKLRILA
ncbi:MAG: HD domain-containing protein [Anaerolineae bacterium]|nr:HD domain-containing protein [Anaerolineae bacterium]